MEQGKTTPKLALANDVADMYAGYGAQTSSAERPSDKATEQETKASRWYGWVTEFAKRCPEDVQKSEVLAESVVPEEARFKTHRLSQHKLVLAIGRLRCCLQ